MLSCRHLRIFFFFCHSLTLTNISGETGNEPKFVWFQDLLALICLPAVPRQVCIELLSIIIWPFPSRKMSRVILPLTSPLWYLYDTTNVRKLLSPLPPSNLVLTQVYQLYSSQENRVTLGLSKRENLIPGIGKTGDGKDDGEATCRLATASGSHHHLKGWKERRDGGVIRVQKQAPSRDSWDHEGDRS